MAVVKYGAIITDIKGSINGMTLQGGRSAGIIRTKPRGVGLSVSNRKESIQSNIHIMGKLAASWTKLTDTQRLTWQTLLGTWTFINKFGVVYNATPYQIYMSVNFNNVVAGFSIDSSAPVYSAGTTITISGYTAKDGGGLGVSILDPLTYDTSFQVLCSKPMKGSESGSRIQYKLLKTFTPSGAALLSIKDEYYQTFGALPSVGSYIWFYTRQLCTTYPRHVQQAFEKVEMLP